MGDSISDEDFWARVLEGLDFKREVAKTVASYLIAPVTCAIGLGGGLAWASMGDLNKGTAKTGVKGGGAEFYPLAAATVGGAIGYFACKRLQKHFIEYFLSYRYQKNGLDLAFAKLDSGRRAELKSEAQKIYDTIVGSPEFDPSQAA